jgi:hypothetical protein
VYLVGPGGDLGFATAILAGWSHRRSLRRIRSPVNLHCVAWAKILSFCNLAKFEHATSGRIGKTPPSRIPSRESRPPSEVKIAAEFPAPSQFPVVTRISTCRLSSFLLCPPKIFVESSLHPIKIGVWVAISRR